MSVSNPPPPEGDPIHQRRYQVDAYRQAADRLLLRGTIHDQKPPGIYIEDDPDPLSVHLMVVDVTLIFPTLEITAVDVVMDVTPHADCSSIANAYDALVGVSIARGFSRTVRELFGGPRGCTHIGALLQAMAPVAIQSMWSMRSGIDAVNETPVALTPEQASEQRRQAFAFNTNTCHIWAADGDHLRKALAGEEMDPPLWAVERLEALGRSPEEWMSPRR